MRANIKYQHWLLSVPQPLKRLFLLAIDAISVILSVWLAYYLRLGEFLSLFDQTNEHFPPAALFIAFFLQVLIFNSFGLYQIVLRFVGYQAFVEILKMSAIYGAVYFVIISLIGVNGVPRTIGIIQPMILTTMICLIRFAAKASLNKGYFDSSHDRQTKRVLIYGAGVIGQQLVTLVGKTGDVCAVGFIDDDPSLHGRKVAGLPVQSFNELTKVAKDTAASEVLLAVPDIGKRKRQELAEEISRKKLTVRALPDFSELINGSVIFDEIKALSIDEILGRNVVDADATLLRQDIKGKVVLVTGAGGSIGSELCHQIALLSPKKLVLVEQNEYSLYSLCQSISLSLKQSENIIDCETVPILASIGEKSSLEEVFREHEVHTIYHTAAYKHVPLVEENPIQALRNNVLGTISLAETAVANNVKKFVFISTDKAVRPTSIMGASKRLAEMALQAIGSEQSNTAFAIVRFGNVLGSSGSVVPLFRKQIRQGGPLTITHPEATRYFMTVSEAAQLVIQAGAMTKVGSLDTGRARVFLLDMGDPIRIKDLAINMVLLSGLTVFDPESNPDGDIEITTIGLRPGEKLHEELLIDDNSTTTEHPKIFVADELSVPVHQINDVLHEILGAVHSNELNRVFSLLREHFADLN